MKYFHFFLLLFLIACHSEQSSSSSNLIESDSISNKEDKHEPALSQASPPLLPDYDTTQWTDVSYLDETVVLDLKYATTDNFVKTVMYECPRCFLRPPAAKALVAIHQDLQQKGLGLKVFDCYRPRPVQYKLWEILPDKNYVANPDKGSMHNRGAAVDLTIVDSTGAELDMGTSFDFFGKKAWHEYQNLPAAVLENRKLLKESMEVHGFKAIRTEWWHYALNGMGYPLDEMVWDCE